jgi:hypothetical protein
VTPDCRFRVSERLHDDYVNWKTDAAPHNRRIVTPSNSIFFTPADAVALHAEQRLL